MMIDEIVGRCVRAAFATFAFSAAYSFGTVSAAGEATSDVLAHGKYLVTGAGQCTDCHRTNFGGGANLIAGPPGAPWAKKVPSLRGLHMFETDADATRFLMTATLPNGKYALGPMPRYNFKRTDASAIVVYLRTLK